MGLQVQFTPADFGYPATLSQELFGEAAIVEVDYSEACQAFCDTFMNIAKSLVPVDTGYLRSTIGADTDGWHVEAYAEAEYAQYVEYGTWNMMAQPYFTPAVEQAWQDFVALAGEAVSFAQEEMEQILSDIMDAWMEVMGGNESLLGWAEGMFMTILTFIVLYPILLIIYGILDTIGSAMGLGDSDVGGMPIIEIT